MPRKDYLHCERTLKGYMRTDPEALSDQRRGLPQPPLEEPIPETAPVVDLPDPATVPVPSSDVTACIRDRVSHRTWADEPLTLSQLSYLLWATQGVKHTSKDGYCTRRTVPSGGARHPFETYLVVNRCDGLEPGLYRYHASAHQLRFLGPVEDAVRRVGDVCCGQTFCGTAPVLFCWSIIPYRAEWRYKEFAVKCMLLDAGHVGQNLYLACEALGLGTCAIAAYMQEDMDAILGLDGENEFTVYLSPVGVPRRQAG